MFQPDTSDISCTAFSGTNGRPIGIEYCPEDVNTQIGSNTELLDRLTIFYQQTPRDPIIPIADKRTLRPFEIDYGEARPIGYSRPTRRATLGEIQSTNAKEAPNQRQTSACDTEGDEC